MKKQRKRWKVTNELTISIFCLQELGGDADIAAANKTDDEKLTEAGLVAALTVVTDIITDDMKHDMAGRWGLHLDRLEMRKIESDFYDTFFSCRETPVTDEEKAGAA